jgi:hypothetical protein
MFPRLGVDLPNGGTFVFGVEAVFPRVAVGANPLDRFGKTLE